MPINIIWVIMVEEYGKIKYNKIDGKKYARKLWRELRV